MSQGKLRIRCHHKLAARFNGWDLESCGWGGDGAERKDRAGVLPRSRSRRGCGLFRFTSFLPGTGPVSGGFSARTFFGVSNSSTGAAGSASFGFSSVGSGEDSINGFTRLAKFRRARARAEFTVDREDDAA